MNFKPLKKAMLITAILVFVSAASICFGIINIAHGTGTTKGIAMICIGAVIAIGWIMYLAHVVKNPDKNK